MTADPKRHPDAKRVSQNVRTPYAKGEAMTAARKPSLILALVCFAIAFSFGAALLFGEVHVCGPNLCNGSAVISQPHPPGKVLEFKVQGPLALYTSNATCRRELYVVPVAGGPVKQLSQMTALDPQDPCFRNVTPEFSFSPDGQFSVYEADGDYVQAHPAKGDQDYQIYSVPIAGGPVMRLNPALAFDFDVERHQVTCDSRRVVYRQGKDSSDKWELWSADIRTPNSGRRISQVAATGQDVGAFHVRCDGTVTYEWDATTSGVYKRYMVGVTGGYIWTEIFSDGFELGDACRWSR